MTSLSRVNAKSKKESFCVSFLTLGCAKNEVDTRHMAQRLLAAGYTLTDRLDKADAVVVNTCCFIQSATEESIDAIFECADLPNIQAGAPLVVAGCMPSRYGEDLEEALTEVKTFIPCSREDDIVAILDKLFACAVSQEASSSEADDASRIEAYVSETEAALGDGLQAASFAYVKISDGCNRFCSYCAIPYIRGRYRSFPYEDIFAEVSQLVSQGVQEIVLIAQDTGIWGSDFAEPDTLSNLLSRLAEAFPSLWFRVMYTEPEGVTDGLLQVMAEHANICNYLDIPLQHVVPSVLHRMHRQGSSQDFLALVDRARKAVPGISLRTTLMAGFPGESEDDFQELCDFVEEAAFDYVGVFAFSPEEGTEAFGLSEQVVDEVKLERAQQLRDIADTISFSQVAKRIGADFDILIEGREEDGQVYGRAMCQAPEVDGVTYVSGGQIGTVVRVRIQDTLLYEMEGE